MVLFVSLLSCRRITTQLWASSRCFSCGTSWGLGAAPMTCSGCRYTILEHSTVDLLLGSHKFCRCTYHQDLTSSSSIVQCFLLVKAFPNSSVYNKHFFHRGFISINCRAYLSMENATFIAGIRCRPV